MAAVKATFTDIKAANPVRVITWTGITENDTGDVVYLPDLNDFTIGFRGTFGGATVALEGSIDGTNFYPATDPQGNAISKTSAAAEAVQEAFLYWRIARSAGSSASLTVEMVGRRVAR